MPGDIETIIERSREEGLARRVDEHDRKIESMGETVTNIDKNVTSIHTALMGTLEKKGVISEHRDLVDFMAACKKRKEEEAKEQKKERIDWAKWLFRSVGALVIGWMAYKVGLK